MIRLATTDDIPALVAMGQRFISETSYNGKLGNNAETLADLMGNLIAHDDGCVFVSTEGDEITGMIGAYIYAHPMSGERIAGEAFWWVEPEKRGGGVKLVLVAEKWAREHGAARFVMVAPNDKVAKLYRAFGYDVLETHFQKDL